MRRPWPTGGCCAKNKQTNQWGNVNPAHYSQTVSLGGIDSAFKHPFILEFRVSNTHHSSGSTQLHVHPPKHTDIRADIYSRPCIYEPTLPRRRRRKERRDYGPRLLAVGPKQRTRCRLACNCTTCYLIDNTGQQNLTFFFDPRTSIVNLAVLFMLNPDMYTEFFYQAEFQRYRGLFVHNCTLCTNETGGNLPVKCRGLWLSPVICFRYPSSVSNNSLPTYFRSTCLVTAFQ